MLHDRVSHVDGSIVGDDCARDFWDGTKRRVPGEEMEIVGRRSDDFFVEFVKDGPEFNAEWPVNCWKGEFVHGFEATRDARGSMLLDDEKLERKRGAGGRREGGCT